MRTGEGGAGTGLCVLWSCGRGCACQAGLWTFPVLKDVLASPGKCGLQPRFPDGEVRAQLVRKDNLRDFWRWTGPGGVREREGKGGHEDNWVLPD